MSAGKSGTRNIFLLVVLLIAGILVGGLIAAAAQHVTYLSWLAYSKTFGLSVGKPAQIDFSVLKLAFGIELTINVAQIICMAVAALLYRKLR